MVDVKRIHQVPGNEQTAVGGPEPALLWGSSRSPRRAPWKRTGRFGPVTSAGLVPDTAEGRTDAGPALDQCE